MTTLWKSQSLSHCAPSLLTKHQAIFKKFPTLWQTTSLGDLRGRLSPGSGICLPGDMLQGLEGLGTAGRTEDMTTLPLGITSFFSDIDTEREASLHQEVHLYGLDIPKLTCPFLFRAENQAPSRQPREGDAPCSHSKAPNRTSCFQSLPGLHPSDHCCLKVLLQL